MNKTDYDALAERLEDFLHDRTTNTRWWVLRSSEVPAGHLKFTMLKVRGFGSLNGKDWAYGGWIGVREIMLGTDQWIVEHFAKVLGEMLGKQLFNI